MHSIGSLWEDWDRYAGAKCNGLQVAMHCHALHIDMHRVAGLALPPYIVFSSGKTFHHTWAPEYETDVKDMNGNPIKWRYNHNVKGSVTEEWAADYLKNIIAPILHGTKPRHEAPGEQGVIFCDGVGTHLGINVLETAIEMGSEIVLRVPHLSFVLQGEDTINFGPLKVSSWQPATTQIQRHCT